MFRIEHTVDLFHSHTVGPDSHSRCALCDYLCSILLNIVFGIIIDTFGDLRRQREKKKQDLFHKCQICAKQAAEFDRHADGFDAHWTRDHNVWSYIFFYVHLKTKPKLDFTGVEAFVHRCLQEHSIAWFPLHKAMSLRRTGAAAEEDLGHRLASIEGGQVRCSGFMDG